MSTTASTTATTKATTTRTVDVTTRSVPPMGGFNTTMLGIELRRMLRNRRTIIFTLIFPAAMFFAFGGQSGWDEKVGSGNVAAYILVSMALYGAALTAAAGGAMVAIERSLGWSRSLRLTPLNPAVYILTKALVALTMGAIAVTVVNIAGVIQGKPHMPIGTWISCALLTVVCTLVLRRAGRRERADALRARSPRHPRTLLDGHHGQGRTGATPARRRPVAGTVRAGRSRTPVARRLGGCASSRGGLPRSQPAR